MARATCLPPQASPRPRACRSPPANRSQKRSRRAGRRRRGMLVPRRSAPRTGRSAASAGGSAPRLHAVWLTAALGCATANLLCACPRRWKKRGFAELLRPLLGKTIRQRLVCSNEAVEMPLPPVCLRQPPAQSLKSQRRSGVSGPSGATPALTACTAVLQHALPRNRSGGSGTVRTTARCVTVKNAGLRGRPRGAAAREEPQPEPTPP